MNLACVLVNDTVLKMIFGRNLSGANEMKYLGVLEVLVFTRA